MNKISLKLILGLLSSSLFFGACKSDKTSEPDPGGQAKSKYVVMTVTDRNQPNGGGYISAFDQYPSGTISNVTGENSLQGVNGMAGWRPYGNWIFKMVRSSDAAQGIEKIEVAPNGKVTVGQFISSKNPTEAAKYFGTGNFVIQNETSGFYWDAAEPLNIQKFSPAEMRNTGSIELAQAVNENIKENDAEGIKFKAIGQKFLAIKGGKLFANITYGKTAAKQAGFFDDYFPDIYIAVIDIATGKHEKTIKIENAGGIAYINDNPMYDFDTNGDLYIVTQGTHAQGLGGKSKIVRIKANETNIDKDWTLRFSDFRAADDGKFVGVHAKNGQLILVLNTDPLTGGPTGNINSKDIWKFYSVNVNQKEFKEINGIPVGVNPGAALAVVEIDDKVLLRGAASAGVNAYFEYNYATNTATKSFEVKEGGTLTGFVKIQLK
ncbi:hypothetical protein [Sphingobacterium yanglingense]|uniref:DUF4374 domain-containing protein n=1 Tax=Sphingobacterium yanglingense TaxID=1437280 RepID=A0A4R6WEI0_9SPHI|nr:hypothetical protein [Sphingobacterium yanglingense]TDQ78202.1 hypothetical protein CLV99_2182 [Sphingobacterium yanglingense]